MLQEESLSFGFRQTMIGTSVAMQAVLIVGNNNFPIKA